MKMGAIADSHDRLPKLKKAIEILKKEEKEREQRQEYDLIVYEHTHKPKIVEGNPIMLNPGELCGWVYGRSTFVILNTDEKKIISKEL